MIPEVVQGEAEGVDKGREDGSTRGLIVRLRQEWRFKALNKAISEHREQSRRRIYSWKERDKLTSAFLLANPGPGTELSSQVFAEVAATYLCLPSRICKDRVGEKIGKSTVDRHGERVILEALPGGHWTERHDTLAKEVSALCNYAGIVSEREPFGLFGYLVPQSALSRLQSSQVLRPDHRMELPKRKTRPPDRGRQDDRQAQSA